MNELGMEYMYMYVISNPIHIFLFFKKGFGSRTIWVSYNQKTSYPGKSSQRSTSSHTKREVSSGCGLW